MTTIDRLRKLAAMGLVMAAGAYLHLGMGERLAVAQTAAARGPVLSGAAGGFPGPGAGVPQAPVFSGFGISPVLPGNAHFLPYSNNLMQSSAALAADSTGYAGYGGLGYGGLGYGGFGYGGFVDPVLAAGMMGAPGMYGYTGGMNYGLGMSLPPTPEIGGGALRAGNQLADPNGGMGMGAGNPADPTAPAEANAGQLQVAVPSEDAFDNAANGRVSPSRHGRSSQGRSARRHTVRRRLHQPPRKAEAQIAEAEGTSRPEAPRARPQQAKRPQEKPSPVKPDGAGPAPRKSVLGSPR